MSDNTTSGAAGLSFLDLLAVAFIVLKLTGVIDWSWWWVLSPFWIPMAVIGVIALLFIIGGVINGSKRRSSRFRR